MTNGPFIQCELWFYDRRTWNDQNRFHVIRRPDLDRYFFMPPNERSLLVRSNVRRHLTNTGCRVLVPLNRFPHDDRPTTASLIIHEPGRCG